MPRRCLIVSTVWGGEVTERRFGFVFNVISNVTTFKNK
jgi:hypothetical protein